MQLPATAETPRRRLEGLLASREGKIDLAEAALLVACEEYPGLDVRGYLLRLDEMGLELRRRLDAEGRPERAVMALNRYLFHDERFRGNTEEYYDPRNSYLNQVLDRRTGIPITLSTVYIEVARRAGLEVEGVGLPGHFVVRIKSAMRPLLVDPFYGGTLLTAKDCQARLDRIFGGRVRVEQKMLRPCDPRDMLERMLRNLKAIYLRDQDVERALRIVDLLVRMDPTSSEDLRDRGILYASLDCYGLAAQDIEAYLKGIPAARDAEELRSRLVQLRHKATRLN